MTVDNKLFKQTIPKIHPLSLQRNKFWKEEKRRCIEGFWAEGKWMPGVLYFFVNHWHIELNLTANSKQKVVSKPFLRDLEWEKGYVHAEARGFSGFVEDEYESCHRVLKSKTFEKDIRYLSKEVLTRLKTPKGDWKKYVPAREYLRRIHTKNLGQPLYDNFALNVVDIESRGTGKSFWGSCMIAHNFLTDGVTSYADLKLKPTSETLVGAIDSFYSNGILKKVQLGLDNLEGGIEFQGDYYPPPLSKSYSGSWASGKTVIALTEVQKGNSWLKVGSKSKIQHRTFASNPFAGNGTRPGFTLIEEVGFMDNLQEALGQLKECTANGAAKFGTIWMTGTGGDMSGGATEAVKAVFYDPEAFDCVPFVDEWEGNAKPIGFFVPAWKGLNQFKDEQGNTDEIAALGFLMDERRIAGQAKSKQPLNDELQQRPIKPSEAFLVTSGNVFPVADLKDHLNWLRAQPDDDVRGDKGTFTLNKDNTVTWKPDLEDKLTPCIYPMKEKDDTTGAVVIWEHPDESADYGYYIAGCDPYDLDKAPNSVSLGSFVLMRRAGLGNNHDKIVAEYTARPETAKDFYETGRRLLMYYGATCLHENEKNQIKMYFEQKHSLSLLAYTPTVLKANQASKVSRMYGQHMSKVVKNELELLTRDWLQGSAGEGTLNLHHIYSEPLLEELIAYNEDGNFDRVIALMLAICLQGQFHQIVVEKKEEIKKDPFFERKLFTNRR